VVGKRRPLAESERAYFEPRFVYDFSQVRVHTDARAYTLGQDVVFEAGQYSPGTNEWRRLMAHAVQQTQSRITSNQT